MLGAAPARRRLDPVLGDAAAQGSRVPRRPLGRAPRRGRSGRRGRAGGARRRRRLHRHAGLDARAAARAVRGHGRRRTRPSSSTRPGRPRTRRASSTRHAYCFAKRMQAERWLAARPGDLVWCTAGTGWAKSIWNVLLGPWSAGAAIVLHEGAFDPEERFRLLAELGVTVLCQAPTEYRLMAKQDGIDRFDLLARPAHGLGRRAAQPGGDQGLPGRVRADDPRRLRPDGEHAARRQHAGRRDPAGLDGASVARVTRSP